MSNNFKGKSLENNACMWIDEPDATDRLNKLRLSDVTRNIIASIITEGFAIVPRAVPDSVCKNLVTDYEEYVKKFPESEYRDSNNHNVRFVNFHLASPNGMIVATNSVAHDAISEMFRAESCAYTSLFFKHGSQQALHRDTPHFCTYPEDSFFGLWTALEDVTEENGPLVYVPGSHRLAIPPAESYVNGIGRIVRVMTKKNVRAALEKYNSDVIAAAQTLPTRKATIKRGDIVIWHPKLVHGGSIISKPGATRYSLVTHCAPRGVYVSYANTYFSMRNKKSINDKYRTNYQYQYEADYPFIKSPRIYPAFQYDYI